MMSCSHNSPASFGVADTSDLGDRPIPLGTIRLAELVGSGRHGMVFRADQITSDGNREVAVKIPNGTTSLTNEAIAIQRFSHHHAVELVDGPLPNGSLILEFFGSGTLADRAAHGSLSPGEIRSLFDALVDALSPVHAAGWIHGDICPGNIGLRASGEPALFDFATARPGDGAPMVEGTAEFAGSFRRADPRLDVRCLAATGIACLEQPEQRTEVEVSLASDLELLIDRCDSLHDVELLDLREVVSLIDPEPITRNSGTGRPVSERRHTRTYGPRPDAVLSLSIDASTPRRIWIFVVGLFVAALIIGLETAGTEIVGGSHTPPVDPPTTLLTTRLTAAESLLLAEVQWDAPTGVVARRLAAGNIERFAAGRSGDVAAVADWNCDGLATLGVYRPDSNTWFVFNSWEADATSTSELLDPRGSTVGSLELEVSADGCATPIVV